MQGSGMSSPQVLAITDTFRNLQKVLTGDQAGSSRLDPANVERVTKADSKFNPVGTLVKKQETSVLRVKKRDGMQQKRATYAATVGSMR